MALGNVDKFEISEARDFRAQEGVESWRAMRECESEREKVHTGEFESTTGQVYSIHARVFIQVELRLSVIIGAMHSHFEYVYMRCEPTE